MNCDYWVILVAAGEGRRLGGPVRKAAIRLHGKTLASISLAAAMAHSSCRGAALVVHPDDFRQAGQWIEESGVAASQVELVVGGKDRRSSVLAGLEVIAGTAGDLVAIHDGARPVLHPDDLHAVVEEATEHGAAILAQRVTDTLHRLDEADSWQESVDRQHLWQALTPQIFPLGILRDALAKTGALATDEVEAVVERGQKVRFVAACYPNPKMTTLGDISMIEALLSD